MVQANQSGDLKKSTALHAGATPARKTKGDVTRSFQDPDKSGRAGTRTDEPKSYRAKGVGKLTIVPIDAIRADPRNPRKHSRVQVRAIARSIDAFGFNAPILVDKQNQIVAGHGRYEAAQLLGLDRLPVISLDHLIRRSMWRRSSCSAEDTGRAKQGWRCRPSATPIRTPRSRPRSTMSRRASEPWARA
jgi:hypothetical protein